jgi:hypothetical protein
MSKLGKRFSATGTLLEYPQTDQKIPSRHIIHQPGKQFEPQFDLLDTSPPKNLRSTYMKADLIGDQSKNKEPDTPTKVSGSSKGENSISCPASIKRG